MKNPCRPPDFSLCFVISVLPAIGYVMYAAKIGATGRHLMLNQRDILCFKFLCRIAKSKLAVITAVIDILRYARLS